MTGARITLPSRLARLLVAVALTSLTTATGLLAVTSAQGSPVSTQGSPASPAAVIPAPLAAARTTPAPPAAEPAAPPPSVTATAPPPGPSASRSPFPPTAPTDLVATRVRAGAVTLTWTASRRGCCDIEGYDISVHPAFNDVIWIERVGDVTTATITSNIRPATQYTFQVTARDGVGHSSASSNAVTVVTPASDSGPDVIPPTAPTSLRVTGAGAGDAVLSWSPSTDNVAVTGYQVYRFDGWLSSTLLATVTGTTYTAPLSASSNLYYVRARDAAGNVSIATETVRVAAPTPPPPPTSPPTTPLQCRVAYTTIGQWPGGFVAGVTLTNTGRTPISGWRLTFRFGGDQRISSSWTATFSQSGPAVTLTSAASSGELAAGATTSVGMRGTWETRSAPPTAFALNGVPCTTA